MANIDVKARTPMLKVYKVGVSIRAGEMISICLDAVGDVGADTIVYDAALSGSLADTGFCGIAEISSTTEVVNQAWTNTAMAFATLNMSITLTCDPVGWKSFRELLEENDRDIVKVIRRQRKQAPIRRFTKPG